MPGTLNYCPDAGATRKISSSGVRTNIKPYSVLCTEQKSMGILDMTRMSSGLLPILILASRIHRKYQ